MSKLPFSAHFNMSKDVTHLPSSPVPPAGPICPASAFTAALLEWCVLMW